MGALTGSHRALGLVLALAVPARATERGTGSLPDHGSGTLYAGAAFGARSVRLRVDSRVVEPSAGSGPALEVGFLRSLGASSLAVGGAARAESFADAWAGIVGEKRYRLDLRVLSEVAWAIDRRRKERPCFTAGVGFGPTVGWIDSPERRVVSERYTLGVGLHAALRLGFRVRLNGRHLGYYAIEGAIHRVATDRIAFVRGSAPRVRERYRFEDYSLGAALGYALSL